MVKNLLRDEVGFRGVVVTDDLHMGAIKNNYTIELDVHLIKDNNITKKFFFQLYFKYCK